MNPDRPWWAVVLPLVPVGLGHLCHLILAVNVACGLGLREAVLERIRAALVGLAASTSVLMIWAQVYDPWWAWPWPARAYAAICAVSGLVVWPISTMAMALRRRPGGIAADGSGREIDLAGTGGGRNALIGEGRGAWLLRLPGNESFRLAMRSWEVGLPGLPAALDGLRIVQLTDLHMARCFQPAFFERVVDASRGWEADLIVVTGDIVEDDEVIDWIAPVLSPLTARLGKFAILGNHDEEHRPPAIVAELGRAGFVTLEGVWTTVEVDGAVIAVGGTSAPWGPDVDPAAMPTADFRVLLSHSPDRFYRAEKWGVDLMISGHNHGGQIRLPMVGAVFMPSVYSRRFDRGFFRREGTLMYASDGIAGMHPVRYGCPPEITRFVLRSGQASGVELEGSTAHGRKRSAGLRVTG